MSELGEITLEVTEDDAYYVNVPSTSSTRRVLGFSVRFLGWCLENTSSSTTATFTVYDGDDTNGVPVFVVNLAANETSLVWLGDRGICFNNAVLLSVTAQSVQGSMFYRHRRQQ